MSMATKDRGPAAMADKRKPACWLFATAKDGISARSLQRFLEIGSYQTAWAMLGRLRSVLVRPGRDRLAGRGGGGRDLYRRGGSGLRGGRARGKKVLTGIAVEVREPKGIGRCRMALLADGSSASLHPFVTGHVEPGATVVTDAWMGYYGLAGLGYVHQRRSQRAARGQDPGEPLPAVRRVASLAKRWLLSTHQGSVRRRICRATAMSSCSASTGAGREAAGWSSAAARARRPPRPGALPQHRHRQAATEDPADAASQTRASVKPGAAASRAPVESR
jgi:ISXO2-like transposase domain